MDRISRKQCRHKPADGTPQPGEHTECNQAARPEGLEHPVEHILHPFQYNDYIDYEKIANGWINLIPARIRPFAKGLADDVEQSMNRYFRGQSLIALCVGVLLSIGFKIVGFPLAVTLGLFIGVLNLIPYLQAIGLIPMVILSLLKSAETGQNFWIIFGSGLLILGIVQCIQDLYLTPRIMGKAMGLNPAIILLSLSIWGTLLGFIGLIIALPLTTLCLSYYKRFILLEEDIIAPPPADIQPEKKKEK